MQINVEVVKRNLTTKHHLLLMEGTSTARHAIHLKYDISPNAL
jgi:hypothetical protein